jgi:hypothetical protein
MDPKTRQPFAQSGPVALLWHILYSMGDSNRRIERAKSELIGEWCKLLTAKGLRDELMLGSTFAWRKQAGIEAPASPCQRCARAIPCTPAGAIADNYPESSLGSAPVDSVVCRGVVILVAIAPLLG